MALLDVSEILLDPDFMDTGLVCNRTTQTVGDDGRALGIVRPTPFAGVVLHDKGDLTERLADGARKKGSIHIYTVFQLTSGRGDITADIVDWQGRQYTVVNVADYKHFGRGFVCASCDLLPLRG